MFPLRPSKVPAAARAVALAAFALALFAVSDFVAISSASAQAQIQTQIQTQVPVQAASVQIVWEVRNRFRLFREERDFQLHVDALRGRSILQSEDWLAPQGDGRGWARNMFARLCIDRTGKVNQPCTRDGVAENYMTPADHAITVRLGGPVAPDATCAWAFDDGDGATQSSFPCSEPINIRVRYGRTTEASVEVASSAVPPQRAVAQIAVRDILIAGLGDSIASGEGNPDRPVALSNEGFCFRSYLTGREYYRPGRAGFSGDKTCGEASGAGLNAWQRVSAQWSNPACHRSLYSYQARTALALAVKFEHIAVTFLPLACSGATIDEGLLGSQRARECLVSKNGVSCQGTVNAQVAELREAMTEVRRRQPQRQLDLVLLTVGANDIGFSGLVADVIVEAAKERALFRRSGVMTSVEEARAMLTRDLPRRFSALRQALLPLVGDPSRVVFTSYANPALQDGQPCASGRDGFDIHPSFNADPGRMANVAGFVQDEFLPQLKNIVLAGGSDNRMTFVDDHSEAFMQHSVCARASTDPEFDRACFSPRGESFNADPVTGTTTPMACGYSPGEFRAYSPRQRWIRTADDSYFAAMTYPQGFGTAPSDIHDALWGVLSAVYGGAIHPTAEGHAAMADAALPAAVTVLGLAGANPDDVERGTLLPLPLPSIGGR